MNRLARRVAFEIALALPLAGCSSSSPLERELTKEFDETTAVPVEVHDDLWMVDGFPVSPDQLADALREAHAKRSKSARIAVLVTLRLQQKTGEDDRTFERRSRSRRQEALDALIAAGARNIQFGPSANAALQSDGSKGR